MKITAITQQVKRANRYSIYVDGKYAFSLSDSALLEQHLALSQELTKAELGKLKQNASLDKLYNKVLFYISLRPRSQWEIESYLDRNNSPPPSRKIILNKLSKLGFINDVAFAQAWVENRHLLKPMSRRRLISELRAKRVSNDVIEEVLSNDDTDEHEQLRLIVERKRKQTKYQDNLKLMQYLSRQGFNYDDIKTVMDES